jgi:hypothetical protein
MTYSNPSPARRGSAGGVIFVILVIIGVVCYSLYQADQKRQREIEETRNALGVGAALLLGAAAASSGNHQAPAPAPKSGNSAENQKLLDMWNKNQNPGMSFSCPQCGGSGRECFNDGTRSPMNRPCGWCNGSGKMQKR